MRSSSLDTFRRVARPLAAPDTPPMPRPAVQLSVLDRQHPSENAAVVQGCVPFVSIDGDSYRMRGHRARLAQLRSGLNSPTDAASRATRDGEPDGVDSLVLASRTGVRLELVPTPRRHADGEAMPVWEARLTGDGLNASRTCPEAGWEPQSLWQFLADLAADWRGWDGERTWQSEEVELRLTAVHNKTNTVTVTAELEDGASPRWKLTADLELDPGVFQTLAADAKRLSDPRSS